MVRCLPDQVLASAKSDLQPQLLNTVRELSKRIIAWPIGQFA